MHHLACPAMLAAGNVARSYFDEERESYPNAKYDTFTAAYNSKRVYGPKQTNGKALIKLVIKDAEVQKAFKKRKKKAKSGKKGKLAKKVKAKDVEEWLTKRDVWRAVTEYGRRYEKVTEHTGSSIAVGEVTYSGRQLAEGSAIVAAQEERGLYRYFALYEEGIEACRTVLRAAKGEEVSVIPNIYGWFDPGRIREIAFEQVTHLLGLLAGESDGGSDDILGDHSIEEIHAMSFGDLEEMAMACGREQAEGVDGDHIGALRFQTLTAIKITIDDIISDLENRRCAAVPCQDEYGPYCFPAAIEGHIMVQNCHGGGTAAHGFDPVTEYERVWTTEEFRYVIDKFGTSGYIIDMKAEINDDNDSTVNVKVPIPEEGAREDEGSYARLLNLENPRDDHGLTTFELGMSQGDGTFATRSHHQILQQVLVSSGRGMRNHVEFNEFLGGMTFEEKYPFTNRDERRYLRDLEEYWQTNYPGIEFAKWCDVDHCVGRSKRWMNNVLFTNLCSHRWNQCMAAVRIRAEDWCFGLGTKAYGNGND